jgi:hypothetical protein
MFDGPTKIYCDLGGVVSLKIIKLWIKTIKNINPINLSYSPDRSRTVRIIADLSKVKWRTDKKKQESTRRLAAERNISRKKCIADTA